MLHLLANGNTGGLMDEDRLSAPQVPRQWEITDVTKKRIAELQRRTIAEFSAVSICS